MRGAGRAGLAAGHLRAVRGGSRGAGSGRGAPALGRGQAGDVPLAARLARWDAGYELPVAPYDPRWRAVVRLEPTPPARIEMPTGTDGIVPFERVGVLRTPWGDLSAWWLAGYGGGLWVPVRDATSGSASYGGGRYLLDTVKGADLGSTGEGRLVLDLNFLYAPSCAHDETWACPLAPPGNVLEVAVTAGELSR